MSKNRRGDNLSSANGHRAQQTNNVRADDPVRPQNQNAITLIALVITIIVLLILAGVALSLVLGEDGITERAINAGKTHNIAGAKEKVELEVANLGSEFYQAKYMNGSVSPATIDAYILAKLPENIDNYTLSKSGNQITLTSKISSDGASVKGTIDENGKVSWNGVETGSAGGGTTVTIPEGLEVGSTVTYYPAGATYTWMGKYATTATITETIENEVKKYTTTDDVELSSNVSGNYRITDWRVLSFNEDTGMIEIVPASHPSTYVKLEGANGYNNAVKLLNDACKKLFVNSSAGITEDDVRSIKVEDIENAMTATAVNDAKGEGYPVSMKNASDTYKTTGYTGSKYYPLIYEKETRGIINGNANSGNDLLDESEQNSLIARDADSLKEFESNGTTPKKGTNGYVNATTSIKPYQTYYSMSLTGSNAKTSAHSTVLCPSSNNYWVASRCVGPNSESCYFNVRFVNGSGLYSDDLFYSNGFSNGGSRAVFPVVSLSSDLLESDGGTGYRLISQRSITQ